MSRLLSKERVRDLLLGLALLCATLALMLYPQPSMEAAKSGLALCYNVIIPSLFPFFVLSSLVVELGLAGYLGRLLEGLMRPCSTSGPAPPLSPWLHRRLPGGSQDGHQPLRERHVHQDGGRAPAGLLQQLRSRLHSGRGGGWGVRQQPGGSAALSGPRGRLHLHRHSLPF